MRKLKSDGLHTHMRQLNAYNMLQLPSKPSCRQGLPTSRTHGCACKPCHPWHLDSGNPCRNDVAILKLALMMGCIPRLARRNDEISHIQPRKT